MDDNVLSLVHRLSRHIDRAFAGELESRFGLALAEWRIVLTLHHMPDAAAHEIVALWAMDKMAISRALRRLEGDGLIRRRSHPRDSRRHLLQLTAAGERLCAKVLPIANARYHDLMAPLSARELATLRAVLLRLLHATAGETPRPDRRSPSIVPGIPTR